MVAAPLATDEQKRIAALREYRILDTSTEVAYDDIARIASQVCNTPIGIISLVAENRQWFKAHVGLDICQTGRDEAFCGHAILGSDVFLVPDAKQDPRFADNPLVLGPPHVRFYAGAPLVTPSGQRIGTLCVIDREPRNLSPHQLESLKVLARQTVSLLELRKAAFVNQHLLRSSQRVLRRLYYQANHDPLTRLANRTFFSQKVRECVEAARSGTTPAAAALLYLDLDRFKSVNDSLGHAAGDDLLRHVARRLRSCVRMRARKGEETEHDVIARLGGDEFTVLLRDMDAHESAILVADRIVNALAMPYIIAGRAVQTSASVGIVPLCGAHANADDAIRDADAAMYEAKRKGKRCYVSFDRAMRIAAERRLLLEHDLKSLFQPGGNHDHALWLAYQPIVSLRTGEVTGFEALARWNHPSIGAISPAEFIPIAEESGLILSLGDWALAEACRQLAEWMKAEPRFRNLSMNVNISRRQLVNTHLVSYVRQVLNSTGLDPAQLHLEITESTAMSDSASTLNLLRELSALGVGLFMDDFGTGHSSLSCLHRFPLAGLKIDRSFIATASQQQSYTAVVHAVLNLARNLNMKVIAEGVESAEQAGMLQGLDCEYAQGFFYGRPIEAGAVPDRVAQDAVRYRCAA